MNLFHPEEHEPDYYIYVVDERGGFGRGILPLINPNTTSERAQLCFTLWQGALYVKDSKTAKIYAQLFYIETSVYPADIVPILVQLENQYRNINEQYGWKPENSPWQWLLANLQT